MKRILCAVIIFCVIVLLGYFFAKPIILFFAEQQIKKVFPGSIVAVDNCEGVFFRQFRLLGIRIKKEPFYDFAIAQATIQYTPASIMRAAILKVILKNATITINLSEQSIQDFKAHINLSNTKSVFVFNAFELSNIALNLTSKEVKVKATISLALDAAHQLLHSCDLAIDSLASGGFQLENASLDVASQNESLGSLFIGSMRYADVAVREVKGRARLENAFLVLDALSAKLLGGEARGELRLSLDQAMRYRARIEFIRLDLDTVAGDFRLKEKLELQGKLGGSVMLEGSGVAIDAIKGDLSAVEGGGLLTIKDDTYLSNLARSAHQSFDIIVDSFKNYHYNTGVMRLFLQDGNLIFDIQLDGESGKRNLTVALHDFEFMASQK